VTEERSVLSLRIRAASVRGKGSRRKRLLEEDLRPQKQEDVHNDQQDLSHVAESYCGVCYHRRFWQGELRRRLYCPPRKAIATLALNSVERLADNALIARKFRALGFSRVRVSGAGAVRRVEGVWFRKDASAALPRQIVAIARL
jgi:hypothetical protein